MEPWGLSPGQRAAAEPGLALVGGLGGGHGDRVAGAAGPRDHLKLGFWVGN